MLDVSISNIQSLLTQFWNWWLGELRDSVPVSLKRFFSVQSHELRISINADNASFEWIADDSKQKLGDFSLAELDSHSLRKVLGMDSSDSLQDVTVEIVLSKSHLLTHSVTLPLATENNLVTVLGFEIDRFTPFVPGEAYYGYTLTGRYPEAEKIVIDLALAKREFLDALVARVRSFGLSVSAVYPSSDVVTSPTESMNLLDVGHRTKPRSMFDVRARKTAAYAVLLLALVSLFPHWYLTHTEDSIRERMESIGSTAQEVAAKRSMLISKYEAEKSLSARKNTVPGKLELVNELTRLIPDNTWVARMSIEDGEIALQGESSKASDLIETLDGSPYFESVGFSSPVTTNRATNMQRFQIEMKLVSP